MKKTSFHFSIYFIVYILSGCEPSIRVNLAELITTKGLTYYNQNRFTGVGYSGYDNGSDQALVEFVKGKKHGNSVSWYPDGQTKNSGKLDSGKKVGEQLGYWPNGSLRYKKSYNKKGLMHGKQEQWHMSGNLARLSNYNSGREDGHQKGWRDNGELRYNYQIVNNKRYGFMGAKVCVLPSI